jgi:cobalt-zinc-cadmium efflux system membrane fusion protein
MKVSLSSLLLLSLLSLSACQQDQHISSIPSAKAKTFWVENNDLFLLPEDPRLKRISFETISYQNAPVLPPASANLAYNENTTVRVTSPISGRSISTPLSLGTQVSKNDVLLKLDSPDFNDALATLEKAEANLKLTKEAIDRATQLYQSKVMSRKDFEQAQDDFASSKAERDRAKKLLEKLGVHVGGISTQTGDFHLRSPLSGVITDVNVNPGMEVRPDLDKPLYVIADLSELWLWVDIFEKDISRVELGQPIVVKVSSWTDLTFTGKVDFISQVVNEATHSIKVRCAINNRDLKLMPSMHATVSIQNLPERPQILLPLSAVVTEGNKHFVFLKTEENRYRWQEVQLGMRTETQAVLKTGIRVGDEIISKGSLSLRQDMLLSVSEPEKQE